MRPQITTMPSSNDLQRDLTASLLLEKMTPLVMLAALTVRQAAEGVPMNHLIVTCLTEWSLAASHFLETHGYPAVDRVRVKPAAKRFLEDVAVQPTTSATVIPFDASASIRAMGQQLAQRQAQEVEYCAYCNRVCEYPDFLPFCSSICSCDARRS
jgi:hypothetical protein